MQLNHICHQFSTTWSAKQPLLVRIYIVWWNFQHIWLWFTVADSHGAQHLGYTFFESTEDDPTNTNTMRWMVEFWCRSTRDAHNQAAFTYEQTAPALATKFCTDKWRRQNLGHRTSNPVWRRRHRKAHTNTKDKCSRWLLTTVTTLLKI